eukprot:sb/3467250/
MILLCAFESVIFYIPTDQHLLVLLPRSTAYSIISMMRSVLDILFPLKVSPRELEWPLSHPCSGNLQYPGLARNRGQPVGISQTGPVVRLRGYSGPGKAPRPESNPNSFEFGLDSGRGALPGPESCSTKSNDSDPEITYMYVILNFQESHVKSFETLSDCATLRRLAERGLRKIVNESGINHQTCSTTILNFQESHVKSFETLSDCATLRRLAERGLRKNITNIDKYLLDNQELEYGISDRSEQEPTDSSKQPIRTRNLGHVTGYQPIRDQYFLIQSVLVIRKGTVSLKDVPPQPSPPPKRPVG